VVGALQVNNDDEIMLITSGGKIIRIKMDTMRIIGRNTQGVRLVNLDKVEKVVDIARVAEPSSEEEEGEFDEPLGEFPESESDQPETPEEDEE
jgi:DNA gyrase subunit A